jgi:hypothetical protein
MTNMPINNLEPFDLRPKLPIYIWALLLAFSVLGFEKIMQIPTLQSMLKILSFH